MSNPSSRSSARFFIIATLIALLPGATLFLIQAIRSIDVPQDIQYPESAVIFAIYNLWRGEPLYQDFQQVPFAVNVYPPLFYLISAAGAKLFAESIHGIYLSARAVALGATLLTAFVASRIVKQAGGRSVTQLLTALLFLGSSLLLPWGYTARVDSLMLLFVALGLYVLVRWPDTVPQYGAIIFFALALFTKQSALAAPSAAVGLMLLGRRWHQAVLFSLGLGLLLLSIFLVGNYFTDGLLKLNTVEALDAPVRWASISEVFWRSIRGLLLPLGLASVTIGLAVWRLFQAQRENNSARVISVRRLYPVQLITLYLLGALLLAAFSSAKLGSDRNYYLEALLAASLLGGLTLDWLIEKTQRRWRVALVAAAAVCLLAWPDWEQNLALATSNHYVSDNNSAIVELLRQQPGPVLLQDANAALRAGHEVILTDSYHLAVLAARGRWDSAPLASLIRQRRFQAIVLSFDLNAPDKPGWLQYQGLLRWPPEIIQAVNEHYALAAQHGSYYVYYPCGDTTPHSAARPAHN